MADTSRFEHRMSDSDALMWTIEKDPLLRSTITAVALLDGSPDLARVRDKVERGLRLIPRLRQRAAAPPLRVAPPQWVVDPHFDLDYHLRSVRCPGDGTLRDLLDYAAPLAMQGFDRARPLWEFTVVDGMADGKAALIQKVHHSVTDGVGGIELALMLLDMERDPSGDSGPMDPLSEAERPSPLELLRSGMDHVRRRQLGIAQRTLAGVPRVALGGVGAARGAMDTVRSLGRLLTPVTTPLSPIMGGRSLSVHFDVLTAPIAETKAAARKADGKLNDAFVAAVAGGLARYHERHDAPVDALRMTMPISVRVEGQNLGGNQFVPARFPVPLNIADPVERMRVVRGLVTEQRNEPALAFTDAIAGVLNRLPTGVVTQLFGSMLKGIDFVTSNVPGAPFPVFLAGAKVEGNFAFAPLSGAGANITLLSYLDEVQVGVNTDPAAVPDPDVFLACLEEGFDEVRKVG
ncbi:MAG: diacylglycerol O-acyltransferase / wax synthase [Actinomycetota bacterium]|nr:diacylglycerol O-acyltransferase / wax synthase [Actinomycetota bacterium]